MSLCVCGVCVCGMCVMCVTKVANAGTVHLNMLFDPTVSPRCAGIFAEKHV